MKSQGPLHRTVLPGRGDGASKAVNLRGRLSTLALSALLVLIGSSPAGAQQEAPEDFAHEEPEAVFVDEVEVAEVLLDVIVTDELGRTVADLSPQDLVVFEGEDVQEIVHMSYVEHGALIERETLSVWSGDSLIDLSLEEDQPGAEEEGPPERLLVLFFHQAGFGLAGRMVHAGHQTGRWIKETIAPGDLVAVVAYDRKLELFQDFTRDTEAIARAALAAATRDPPQRLPADEGAPSLFASFPKRKRALLNRTSNPRKAMKELAQAAGRFPGRKHLFLFSWGQGLRDRRPGLFDRNPEPTMLATLNDYNVAVHSISLETPAIGPQDMPPELDQLSQGTGGVFLAPRNTFSGTLRETTRRIDGVYLVSYRTEIPRGVAGYREIRVEARDPSWQVHSRRGYLYGDP